MFAEWVTVGAIFGIKVFFGIVTFVLCCCALLGLLGLLTSLVGIMARGEKEDDFRRN